MSNYISNVKVRFQEQLNKKWLTTEIKPWIRTTSAFFYSVFCIGTVIAFFVALNYMPAEKPNPLRAGIFFVFVWLFCELMIILYLYKSYSTPKYVRDLVGILIIFSNMWFILAAIGILRA